MATEAEPVLAELTAADWQDVPRAAVAAVRFHTKAAVSLAKVIEDLPQEGFLGLWRRGEDLLLNVGDWMPTDAINQWESALRPHCQDLEVADEMGQPSADWVKIAFRYRESPRQVKEAFSSALRRAGEVGGYLPGGWADQLGGPTPLSGMLASGLIGAGLGYGTGWLGEQLLPRKWQRGRLRKSLATAGALIGAAPGLAMVADNVRQGRGWNSDAILGYPNDSRAMHYSPVTGDGEANPEFDPNIPHVPYDFKAAELALPDSPTYQKLAVSRTGFELDRLPAIDLDRFNRTIYHDPFVAPRLSPAVQAAASGLLESSHQYGDNRGPRWVRPSDIARISAGMGSGYLSGALVGKTLGFLMGMPESTQQTLKQTGMWAGIVANAVPIAFGWR